MMTGQELNSSSLFETLASRYQHTSFRPSYILISFFTIGYSTDVNRLLLTKFIYFILLYGLFVFSIYKLLKEIFSLQNLKLSQKLLLACFANIFVMCIYFFTTDRIEIFGWYSASTIYLMPAVFTFLSAWFIIKKQTKKTDYIFLLISAGIIAGGAEHMPASVIAYLGIIGIMFFIDKRQDKNFLIANRSQVLKTIFFGGALILFFIFFVTNPGLWDHYNDAKNYTKQNPQEYRLDFFETMKLFFKLYKLIGFALLAVTLVLFKRVFPDQFKIRIKVKYFFAVFSAAIIVLILTSVFAYNSFLVARVWFFVDVAFVVLLAAGFLKLSNRINISDAILTVGSLAMVVAVFLFDMRHVPKLLQFSSAYDKIVIDLQKKQEGETIVVSEFPKPDLTNQVEFSVDSNNAENQLFCRFYSIKAKVSVKK